MGESAVNDHRLVRFESNIQKLTKYLPLQLFLDFDFIIQPDLTQCHSFFGMIPDERKVRLYLLFFYYPWVITHSWIDESTVGSGDLKNLLVRLNIHAYGDDSAHACSLSLSNRLREIAQLVQMSVPVYQEIVLHHRTLIPLLRVRAFEIIAPTKHTSIDILHIVEAFLFKFKAGLIGPET